MNRLFVALFMLMTAQLVASEIDYLALSEVLLRDKNYTRVKSTLLQAKKQILDIDENHYHLLNGLYNLRIGKVGQAIESLQKVDDKEYFLKKQIYLAQCYLEKGLNEKALESVSQLSIQQINKASIKTLIANVYFENQKIKEAMTILKVLDSHQARKQEVHFLLRLGLHEAAIEKANNLLDEKVNIKQNDILGLYVLFDKYQAKKQALLLLERGRIHLPKNIKISQVLASLYDQKKMYLSAGKIFTDISYLDPSLANDTVEYLRQRKLYIRSQNLAINIVDRKKQVVQKLSSYIAMENYNLAYSLEKSLKHVKGLEDDQVKYAFAYTYLIQGKYEQSLDLLNKIKEAKLINRSLKLRSVIQECQEDKWVCYGTL